MTDPTPPSPSRGQRIVGVILMTVGLLVAGLCGLCSVVLVGGRQDFRDPNAVAWDAVVAVIGGGSTLAGAVTFAAGLLICRRK